MVRKVKVICQPQSMGRCQLERVTRANLTAAGTAESMPREGELTGVAGKFQQQSTHSNNSPELR